MAANRGTNTQIEALRGLLSTISEIKTFPDADIEWLLTLETQILQKIREPIDNAFQNSGLGDLAGTPQGPQGPGGLQGPPAGPSPAPPDGAGLPFGGPAPSAPSGAGGGVPGIRTSPGAPNPDELRRLLQGGQ